MPAPRISLGPVWDRTPDDDIDCPICLFEVGHGKALSYKCMFHPTRPQLVGTHAYYCPRRQREVSSIMVMGLPSVRDELVKLAPVGSA